MFWGRAISALLVLLACSSSGCAVLSVGEGGHEAGSASLSDAARAARPDSSKHRSTPLDVGYTTPPAETEPEETVAAAGLVADGSPGPAVAPASSGGGQPILFGLVAGGGVLGGTGYDGFSTYGLSIGGFVTPKLRLDLIGSASNVRFTGEGVQGQSLDDALDLGLDLTARYYLTGRHTLVGIYPLVGIATGTLFWDYATPVSIVEDGEVRKVEDDRINHFDLYGGMGMSLIQVRHLHLGGNLTGGVRIYGWQSKNGFSNDLFPTTGFVLGRLEVHYQP